MLLQNLVTRIGQLDHDTVFEVINRRGKRQLARSDHFNDGLLNVQYKCHFQILTSKMTLKVQRIFKQLIVSNQKFRERNHAN
jgi:hypothetical protein